LERAFFTRNLWIYYIVFWMAIAVIQFALSYGVYEQDMFISVADSLISNIIFAVLGIGLWYMVRFSGKQSNSFVKIIFNHLAVCVITIVIWQVLCYALLRTFFGDNEEFMKFLITSEVVRCLTGILIYFLIVSVDFLVLSFEEMQAQAEHEASLSAMLRDAELSMLRSQIRPHFLFNSLNSVSSLTLSNPQAAQDMIIKLSDFMRHSLTLGADTMNSLSDELYHAGLYLDIEKVRFSDRMIVEKNINPDCGSMMLPAMILQPILENAVKHGVNTMLSTCNITLKAECNGNYLVLSISNNFDPDAVPRKGTGTGLSNVQKRMAAIYGRNDLLATTAIDQVFEVKLRIPAGMK
jgi:two-component system, LytTR family, sensor kinase